MLVGVADPRRPAAGHSIRRSRATRRAGRGSARRSRGSVSRVVRVAQPRAPSPPRRAARPAASRRRAGSDPRTRCRRCCAARRPGRRRRRYPRSRARSPGTCARSATAPPGSRRSPVSRKVRQRRMIEPSCPSAAACVRLEHLIEMRAGAEAHLAGLLDLVEEGGAEHARSQGWGTGRPASARRPRHGCSCRGRSRRDRSSPPSRRIGRSPARSRCCCGSPPWCRRRASTTAGGRLLSKSASRKRSVVALQPVQVPGHVARDLPGARQSGRCSARAPSAAWVGAAWSQPLTRFGKYQLRMKVIVALSPGASSIGAPTEPGTMFTTSGPTMPRAADLAGIELGQQAIVRQVVPELAQRVVPAAAEPLRLGRGRPRRWWPARRCRRPGRVASTSGPS